MFCIWCGNDIRGDKIGIVTVCEPLGYLCSQRCLAERAMMIAKTKALVRENEWWDKQIMGGG